MQMIGDIGGTCERKLTFTQPSNGTVREDLTAVFSLLKCIAIAGPVWEARDCSKLKANLKICSCGSLFSPDSAVSSASHQYLTLTREIWGEMLGQHTGGQMNSELIQLTEGRIEFSTKRSSGACRDPVGSFPDHGSVWCWKERRAAWGKPWKDTRGWWPHTAVACAFDSAPLGANLADPRRRRFFCLLLD